MKHEIDRTETATQTEPWQHAGKVMHRIHCACGRIGAWYFSKVTMREMHAVHQRAASARDASQVAADRVTGVR